MLCIIVDETLGAHVDVHDLGRGRQCTAVGPVEQALFFEMRQVFPYCSLCHAEFLRQVRHFHKTILHYAFKDVFSSFSQR